MRTSIVPSLVAITALSLAGAGAQTPPPVEALDGVDPVLLLKTGKETFGRSAFKSQHGRFVYLFASADTKAEFDTNPERYVIQMNGACARMGSGSGNQSNYAVVDGRIYIFASDGCQKAFVSAPARFLPRAPVPMPADAAAVAAGQALLDRAARAHGGDRLDALASYTEFYDVPAPMAAATAARVTIVWRYPDTYRAERTFRMDDRQMRVVTLLSDGQGWSGPSDAPQLRPVNPVVIPGLQQQARALIVPLLRLRSAPGTKVAALPQATVDGVRLDRVRLVREGLDVTLSIDPASGRVHSTTAIDRGPDSGFGEFVVYLGDYREVDGVLIPFSQKALFDGRAEATRVLGSAAVNPALDPALFRAGRQ
jgi:YHS domain-containing protein